MRQKSVPTKEPAEQVIKGIRRATRRHFSAEDKIRIVLAGLRGEYRRSCRMVAVDSRGSTLQGSKILFIGRLPRRDQLPHDGHRARRFGDDPRSD